MLTSLRSLPRDLYRRAQTWAISNSASVRGLLYLPVPDQPIAAPNPRAPTTPGWYPITPDGAGDHLLDAIRSAGAPGQAAAGATMAIHDWLQRNPLGTGPDWEPARLARVLTCFSRVFVDLAPHLAGPDRVEWLRTIFLQSRYLATFIDHDTDPRAIAQYRALLGAANVVGGSEARSWLRQATSGLESAIRTQFLADGGHISRSPTTHLRCLADLSDVVSLLPRDGLMHRAARELLPGLSRFASRMQHPDGSAPRFGAPLTTASPVIDDAVRAADLAIGRSHAAAGDYGDDLEAEHFPHSGFTAMRQRALGDALLIDWRGPDDRPLTGGTAGDFELSFAGQSIIGSPALGDDGAPHRAHNGVCVDGSTWRRPDAVLEEAIWGEGPGFGYLGLQLRDGNRTLDRRFLAFASRSMVVIDRVTGGDRSVEQLLHLGAGVRVVDGGTRRLFLERGDRCCTLAAMPGVELGAEPARVVIADGTIHPTLVVRLWAPAGGPRTLGFLIVEGRRRDARLELVDRDEGRVALRFDPRRYLVRWRAGAAPRLELAD